MPGSLQFVPAGARLQVNSSDAAWDGRIDDAFDSSMLAVREEKKPTGHLQSKEEVAPSLLELKSGHARHATCVLRLDSSL